MRAYDIIKKKRDKESLSKDEISYFITGCTNGSIPDYQVSALLMSIYLNGMTDIETAHLTEAMAYSGKTADLSSVAGIKTDKHSTGGVGDKTTLVIGPIVASCGVLFSKMSGRGLGHTGGTIDKLESVPGFSTEPSHDEFISLLRDEKIAISVQTGDLAPADKILYSLRDVTATVSSIPLIASSIMSKKIAGGADKILLDVKTGSGAFMKTYDESLSLAVKMVRLGKLLGRDTMAYITDMEQPLGKAVGNSIEVVEAIETLKGNGPDDLMELCIMLSSEMLSLAEGITFREAEKRALKAVSEGKALEKLHSFIASRGGNTKVLHDYSIFKKAVHEFHFMSASDGYLSKIDAGLTGEASMVLGAGRERKGDPVDPSAGIYFHKKERDEVRKGQVLLTMFTDRSDRLKDAEKLMKEAIAYSKTKPVRRRLIHAKVDSEGIREFDR